MLFVSYHRRDAEFALRTLFEERFINIKNIYKKIWSYQIFIVSLQCV